MTYPTLFKRKGKTKITSWTISVEGTEIITKFGEIGGKFQEYKETISEGKNIGRSNETTPAQQAEFEAWSSWNYKKDRERYVESIDKVDDAPDVPVAMLAQSYEKHAAKIEFPAYQQPKFDGSRCLAVTVDGICTLYSRTGKIITGVPHINLYLEKFFDNTTLDGELYNHEYRKKFEELMSFIRSETPKAGHEVVQFHVYDVISIGSVTVGEQSFESRHNSLTLLFARAFALMETHSDSAVRIFAPIIPVVTSLVEEEGVSAAFKVARAAEYEGIMLRNKNGPYVGKRSYDLQKVKEMDDAEFLVVDITEGRGKMAGHAMLVCQTEKGETFTCKMKKPYEYLKMVLERKAEFVGKQVTVQFQDKTVYGMPRFPVGLRFRDVE